MVLPHEKPLLTEDVRQAVVFIGCQVRRIPVELHREQLHGHLHAEGNFLVLHPAVIDAVMGDFGCGGKLPRIGFPCGFKGDGVLKNLSLHPVCCSPTIFAFIELKAVKILLL